MEGKNQGVALMMTRTPIVVRDYYEDVVPVPVTWDLNAYVIHDPSLRSQMPAGTNLISERVRYKYYFNKNFLDNPYEPPKALSEKPTLTPKSHRKTTLAQKIKNNKPDAKEGEDVHKVSESNKEKLKGNVGKLSKYIKEHKDNNYSKKTFRPKGVRIERYGNAYNSAKLKAEHAKALSNFNGTHFEPREHPKPHHNSATSSLTLKDLFESSNMSKALCSISSEYASPKSKISESIQPLNYEESISEQEKQQRSELIRRYGGRPLSHFITPHRVNKLTELPELIKTAMNWRLARAYMKMGSMCNCGEEMEEEDVSLSALNDRLLARLAVTGRKRTQPCAVKRKCRVEEVAFINCIGCGGSRIE